MDVLTVVGIAILGGVGVRLAEWWLSTPKRRRKEWTADEQIPTAE